VYPFDNTLHERQFKTFLEQLECEEVPQQHIMRTLRKLDAFEIKRASEATFYIYNPSVTWPFQPVVDGEGGMIPLRPIDAWNRGEWHQVPILTGFNTNEGAMFVPDTAETGEEFTDFFKTLLPTLTEEDLQKLNEVYPDPTLDPSSKYVETREEFGAQFKRLEQAYGHFAYIAPVRQTARYASAGSERASVYLYQFAASTSMKGGADHESQAQLVSYDPEIRDVSDSVDEITGVMHAYWTSFITTGDPNKVSGRFEDRPEWPAYNSESNKIIVFGEGNDEIAGGDNEGVVVQVVDDEWAKEECRFWWERTDLSET
jgi:acetylcholinesterase